MTLFISQVPASLARGESPIPFMRITNANYRLTVYIYLIDTTTIYVGMSSNLSKRGKGTHTEGIHKRWHTIIAFPCSDDLNDSELKYIENALCEYFYCNNIKLCNKNPIKEICNEESRREHHRLSQQNSRICTGYVEDIIHYISILRDSHFPCTKITKASSVLASTTPVDNPVDREWHDFTYTGEYGMTGEASIQIINGKAGKATLKKGTVVSREISKDCTKGMRSKRAECESNGILVDRTLQEDLPLHTAAEAIVFLTGNSASAPECWKSKTNGGKLKDFLHP